MKFIRKAFTLIELLVVIAIIAILAAILFPVFAQAKESAKVSTALASCKQLLTSFQIYMADFDDTPALGGLSMGIDEFSVGTSEWQEAMYPYVKNEGIYKVPGDRTTVTRTWTNCPSQVANQTDLYSASSFITNFTLSQTELVGTRYTRSSPSMGTYSAPADYILFMNGQRPTMGGLGTGRRFFANPRDHNGDECSLWIAAYTQRNEGGMGHILNPDDKNKFRNLPHHKNAVIFGFMDGHAKVVAISKSPDAAAKLEGRYPWCKHGIQDSGSPICGIQWNSNDTLD
jgi:prepilin-type N-terminal cleavage/methylation domain-containing protein